MKVKIELDSLDACLADLNGCAKCGDDDSAIFAITRFANALLSAYEIQRDSYKR